MIKILDFDYKNVPTDLPKMNLCLGFFDGIHIGHQKMIKSSIEEGVPTAVLTFDNPPNYYIGKISSKNALTSIDDKADYLEEIGVDYLLVLTFDEELLNLTKDQFIYLVLKPLNPLKIIVGPDYSFGYKGEGSVDYLRTFFDVNQVDNLMIDGSKVSSRTIREFIKQGNVEGAHTLLGHFYKMCGYVKNGMQNGRSIGFPTANLEPDFPYFYPSMGVYIGYVHVRGENKKCLICVSTHPTFVELNFPIIEVHILDFNADLYGDFISIEFVKRIRDIIKFDDPESLKQQLNKDKIVAETEL